AALEAQEPGPGAAGCHGFGSDLGLPAASGVGRPEPAAATGRHQQALERSRTPRLATRGPIPAVPLWPNENARSSTGRSRLGGRARPPTQERSDDLRRLVPCSALPPSRRPGSRGTRALRVAGRLLMLLERRRITVWHG